MRRLKAILKRNLYWVVLSEEGFLRTLFFPFLFNASRFFQWPAEEGCMLNDRAIFKEGFHSISVSVWIKPAVSGAHRKVQRQCYLAAIEDEETGKLRPPNAGISDFNAHTYTPLPGLMMAATLSCPAYVMLWIRIMLLPLKDVSSFFCLKEVLKARSCVSMR